MRARTPSQSWRARRRAPGWLDDPERGESFRAFRDELAAHIRDSSLPSREPQWNRDEWLRNLYYDLFGPDGPPEDPYPVGTDDWGRKRSTPYLELAIGKDAASSSEGAAAWLAKRGLTREGARRAQPGEPWYRGDS